MLAELPLMMTLVSVIVARPEARSHRCRLPLPPQAVLPLTVQPVSVAVALIVQAPAGVEAGGVVAECALVSVDVPPWPGAAADAGVAADSAAVDVAVALLYSAAAQGAGGVATDGAVRERVVPLLLYRPPPFRHAPGDRQSRDRRRDTRVDLEHPARVVAADRHTRRGARDRLRCR